MRVLYQKRVAAQHEMAPPSSAWLLFLVRWWLSPVALVKGSQQQQDEPSYRGVADDEVAELRDFIVCDGERSVRLPLSAVNDGYCDCVDGSDEPGTSSCSSVVAEKRFWCRNQGHVHDRISLSRVDDGVCDCCDGSDETRGTCVDTCVEFAAKAAEALRIEETVRTKGGQKRIEMACEAQDEMRRAERDLEETSEAISVDEKALEAAEAELEAAYEKQRIAIDADANLRLFEALHLDSLDSNRLRELLVDLAKRTHAASILVSLANQANGLPFDDIPDQPLPCAPCSSSSPDAEVDQEDVEEPPPLQEEEEIEEESSSPDADEEEAGLEVEEEEEGEIDSIPVANQEETYPTDDAGGISKEDAEKMAKARAEMASFMGDDNFGPSPYGDDFELPTKHEDVYPDDDDDDFDYDHYGYEGSDHRDDYHYRDIDEGYDRGEEGAKVASDDQSALLDLSKHRREASEVLKSWELRNVQSLEEKAEKMRSKLKKRKNKHEKAKKILGDGFKGVPEDRALLVLRDACLTLDDQGYTYEICFFDKAKQGRTRLGSFRRVETDEATQKTTMYFDGGEKCYNGPARSLSVNFACGIEHEFRDIDEPATCVYVATVATPAVCPRETSSSEELACGQADEKRSSKSSFLESLYKPLDFKKIPFLGK